MSSLFHKSTAVKISAESFIKGEFHLIQQMPGSRDRKKPFGMIAPEPNAGQEKRCPLICFLTQ
jgi:hypothetical protein